MLLLEFQQPVLAFERPKTLHTVDRAKTVTGHKHLHALQLKCYRCIERLSNSVTVAKGDLVAMLVTGYTFYLTGGKFNICLNRGYS